MVCIECAASAVREDLENRRSEAGVEKLSKKKLSVQRVQLGDIQCKTKGPGSQ